MNEFTLANDSIKFEEDYNSSRSIHPVLMPSDKFSAKKINAKNENSGISNNNVINSTVVEIKSNNSPEVKFHKTNSDDFEIKNVNSNNTHSSENNAAIISRENKAIPVKPNKELRFGKTYPFLFYKGDPLIVIGPFCKLYIIY